MKNIEITRFLADGTIENKNVSEEVDEDLKKVVLETEAKVSAKMDELRVCDAIHIWKRKYLQTPSPVTSNILQNPRATSTKQ